MHARTGAKAPGVVTVHCHRLVTRLCSDHFHTRCYGGHLRHLDATKVVQLLRTGPTRRAEKVLHQEVSRSVQEDQHGVREVLFNDVRIQRLPKLLGAALIDERVVDPVFGAEAGSINRMTLNHDQTDIVRCSLQKAAHNARSFCRIHHHDTSLNTVLHA